MSRVSSRLVVTALAALLSVGALSGCGEKAAEKSAEKQIEKAAADSGEDVDVDIDGDEVSIESSDGSVVMGSGDLPEGYPEDEVPVLDGEILMGTASEGEGYMVVVTVEDEPGAALDEAVSLLEGAGFESDPEMGDMMGETAAVLTTAKYSVMVTAAADTGQTGVTYIVSVE